MILFPAVDIKDGRCVRLAQGKKDQVTIYDDDPLRQALHWVEQGARYLHVIDLDGAFDGQPVNREVIGRICAQAGVPVQLGGGVRSAAIAASYLEAGVTRLIIGTMALAEPEAFGELCRQFPGRIGVSLDAVDGRLKTRGWVQDAKLNVDDVLPRLEAAAIAFLIYTDISRDGMHSGVNLPAIEALCEKTHLPVIAAGGVSTIDDVRALFPLAAKGLQGAVTGRAIYDGTLDFAAAVGWIQSEEARLGLDR